MADRRTGWVQKFASAWDDDCWLGPFSIREKAMVQNSSYGRFDDDAPNAVPEGTFQATDKAKLDSAIRTPSGGKNTREAVPFLKRLAGRISKLVIAACRGPLVC